MWLFQVDVSRLRVLDLQFPKNIPLEGCTLLCRLLFDGKVVTIVVSQLSQVIQENDPVRFRYRLRVATLEELVATLSQRTAMFQVLLINGSWKPTSTDASKKNEWCIGFAATNLLLLAQSESAHYEFHLMAPTLSDSGSMASPAGGGKSMGRMTVTILMEELAEIRLQPTQMIAVGLKDGIYGLRCRLFSPSCELFSSSSPCSFSYGNTSGGGVAVSGTATWSESALMPAGVLFSGTRRALALQLIQLTLLQLHCGGAETSIVSFTLRLTELQELLVDTMLNLPFELRSNEFPVKLCGVLQFTNLPVFVGKVRQMSTFKRQVIRQRDENEEGRTASMLSENALQKSSAEMTSTSIQTTKSITPLESDSFLVRGNLMTVLNNEENTCVPQKESMCRETTTSRQNSDRDIGKREDEGGFASSLNDVTAKSDALLATLQEQKDNRYMMKFSGAILSTDLCEERQTNQEQTISLPPRDKAFTLKGFSHTRNTEYCKKRDTCRSNNGTTSYSLREVSGMENDFLTCEEQRIQGELARTEMHIAILTMSLKDVHASPIITRRALHLQKNTLEQQLEGLNNAEASLLQLAETITRRMECCRKMQCESQEEMIRAREQLKTYSTMLLNCDEIVRTYIMTDGSCKSDN
ncbi:hypothetical protein LSM04_005584 [Trypanosoma melophagium]|uniref:uncharacterized protein n=1 Tax=Trypanosoma melophagium TaxID=715481 RepID=UPI00351A4EE6|nr:hypothetical protein LSM04_005584 [Trypanosoma melophagium]